MCIDIYRVYNFLSIPQSQLITLIKETRPLSHRDVLFYEERTTNTNLPLSKKTKVCLKCINIALISLQIIDIYTHVSPISWECILSSNRNVYLNMT